MLFVIETICDWSAHVTAHCLLNCNSHNFHKSTHITPLRPIQNTHHTNKSQPTNQPNNQRTILPDFFFYLNDTYMYTQLMFQSHGTIIRCDYTMSYAGFFLSLFRWRKKKQFFSLCGCCVCVCKFFFLVSLPSAIQRAKVKQFQTIIEMTIATKTHNSIDVIIIGWP